MRLLIKLFIVLVSMSGYVHAEDTEDQLLCERYIDAMKAGRESVYKSMHDQMREKLVYFGYRSIAETLRREEFRGIKNPESVAYSMFSTTASALKIVTIDYVYEMCWSNKSATLEQIGRGTWLVTQRKRLNIK